MTWRYEWKYLLPAGYPSGVLLRTHPAAFRKIFPDRQVNNIYFDTPGFSAYQDNLMGISGRKKFRLRWYGEDGQPLVNPVLEVKIKENQLGRKAYFPVTGEFAWAELPRLLEHLSENGHPGLQGIRPVLYNAYRRAYFSTFGGRYRLTVDSDLRFGAFGIPCPDWRHMHLAPAEKRVMELKFDQQESRDLDLVTQYLPFRIEKYSKYVNGVELLFS